MYVCMYTQTDLEMQSFYLLLSLCGNDGRDEVHRVVVIYRWKFCLDVYLLLPEANADVEGKQGGCYYV